MYKIPYDRLMEIATEMHTWIFLNSFDEQEAYDEIGLTPYENEVLGYSKSLKIEIECDGTDKLESD